MRGALNKNRSCQCADDESLAACDLGPPRTAAPPFVCADRATAEFHAKTMACLLAGCCLGVSATGAGGLLRQLCRAPRTAVGKGTRALQSSGHGKPHDLSLRRICQEAKGIVCPCVSYRQGIEGFQEPIHMHLGIWLSQAAEVRQRRATPEAATGTHRDTGPCTRVANIVRGQLMGGMWLQRQSCNMRSRTALRQNLPMTTPQCRSCSAQLIADVQNICTFDVDAQSIRIPPAFFQKQ